MRNRGQAPNDHQLFNPKSQLVYYEAIRDMSYLLSRGYGPKSSLQIVGNRYRLNARQQKALLGMSASDTAVKMRKDKEVRAHELRGKKVCIDGFNLLIILESAISGAFLFKGMDGAYRDVTSVHGGYKRVKQTEEAIILIGKILNELGVSEATWYLDAPISNSGRLKTFLREIAVRERFNWTFELVNNPDKELAEGDDIIISSDAWVIEEGKLWFNMMGYLIKHHLQDVEIIYSQARKRIALVTCVKEKADSSCAAKDLYQGQLFNQFMQEAHDQNADEIYILSGKHGLLELEDIIAPYDLNLNEQSSAFVMDWSRQVLTALDKRTNLDNDHFIFITNPTYRQFLVPEVRHYSVPLDIS